MKITKREKNGVTILEVEGKVTIGKGDVALRDAVHEAVGGGAGKILIDLGRVQTIDSSGVGELVSAFTTVRNRGGRLKLLNLPSKVNDILQITQLITVSSRLRLRARWSTSCRYCPTPMLLASILTRSASGSMRMPKWVTSLSRRAIRPSK